MALQRAPSRDVGPSASRIAEILRSTQDPWRDTQVNPVDLAQRVVTQSRRMLDLASGPATVAFGPTGTSAAAAALPPPASDAKVSQLAERVSVLVAGLQQRIDTEKQDTEGQLKQVGVHVEERMRILEARMTACEERAAATERSASDAQTAASALALREARALVGSSMSEADTQWRAHHSELRDEQQQQLRQLEDLAEELRHVASRVERAEGALGGCEQALRRSEDELVDLANRTGQRPPWFGQLEGATAALEQRLLEHQAATEAQLGRLRVDTDGCLRRCEAFRGLREEVLREAEHVLQQELDRLEQRQCSHTPAQAMPEVAQWGSVARDLSRRMDDSEARVAALKVRLDGHDGRIASIGDRSEALYQQALDGTRQACLRQRDEILSEADCQLGILRQRVETLSDLCEELMMRQAPCGQRLDGAMPGRYAAPGGPRGDLAVRSR